MTKRIRRGSERGRELVRADMQDRRKYQRFRQRISGSYTHTPAE